MKSSFTNLLISPDASILDAVKAIGQGGTKIALVVDSSKKLLGTVTDGDIRRGLLAGLDFSRAVTKVMRKDPTTINEGQSSRLALDLMRQLGVHQVPVINEERQVVGIETIDDLIKEQRESTLIVIMSGGLGTRLHPLTLETPKPMLLVGGQPLLATIIQNFSTQGYKRFCVSLNYKAEVIRSYFGDGTKLGIEIDYVHELQPLGTAGALTLLKEKPSSPFIVMNGDLLTTVNFHHLLDFHTQNNSLATMCVRDYTFQVPYGVVETEGINLSGLTEKPSHSFHVNAGIYVIDPEVLDSIPQHTFFDMTQLFEQLLKQKRPVKVFPIHEYWMDIGHLKDFERANGEFQEVFK